MKQQTIDKLNSLLKHYLVNTYEDFGYNPNDNTHNKHRMDVAKLILKTIESIKQDKELHKDKLESLFILYNRYHLKNGGLWKISK